MVLRIFCGTQNLQTHSPVRPIWTRQACNIGAIAFIHRFGSSLE